MTERRMIEGRKTEHRMTEGKNIEDRKLPTTEGRK
jgi:hypothetical protein